MLKQSSKAGTSMLQKRCGEQLTSVVEALEALITAAQRGNAGPEAARLQADLDKYRSSAATMSAQGLSDADLSLADAAALKAALKEAEEANGSLIRRVKHLEVELSLPENVRTNGALPKSGPGAAIGSERSGEEIMILRERVSTLELQLRDAARTIQVWPCLCGMCGVCARIRLLLAGVTTCFTLFARWHRAGERERQRSSATTTS